MSLVISTTIIIMTICLLLLGTRRKVTDYLSCDWDGYQYSKLIIFIFAMVLIVVEGFRHGYMDTATYKEMYVRFSDNLGTAISSTTLVETGFVVLCWVLKRISQNPQLLILLAAVLITFADFRFIIKYSYNLVFTLYLYFLSSFISNMNGIRQLIAASIITFAFPWAEEKKYIRYILVVLFASTFHKSVLLAIPMLFIFSGKRWNKLVIFFVSFCAFSTVFPGVINFFIGYFFKDTYDSYINNYVGANIFNAAIAAVPFVLGLIYHLNNRENVGENRAMDILINMQAMNFGIMLLATTMAQYARLGYYLRHAIVITVPFLIDQVFEGPSRHIVKIIAIIMYFIIFAIEVHLSYKRGYYNSLYLDFGIFK